MSSRFLAHFIPETADVDVNAGLASGTGAAANASPAIFVNAGLASGTGAGLDATVTTQTSTSVDAGLASGSGAAAGPVPSVAPITGSAAGTGAASNATITIGQYAFADAASGSGAASGAAPSVAPSAGSPSGTGSAFGATADTASACDDAFQSDAFQFDAFQICGDVSVNAGVATGTGQAFDAIGFIGTGAYAEVATGTGAAGSPTPSVAPHPGVGDGFGTSYQTMVVGVATGSGEAYDAAIYAEDNYGAVPEGDIATGYMPPLAAPIDDNDTTIIVQYPSTTAPDEPFVVLIDGEQILVTNVSGTTWTVERGYNGSTATSHSAGAVARPGLVRVTVGGINTTLDTSYQRSRFSTGANGQAGTAEIWIRDLDRTRAFVTGDEVVVTFRGLRQWGGYVANVRRQYIFEAGTGSFGNEPRWLILDCVDYNVLFNKRIFYDPLDPTDGKVKHWRNGTWDAVVIRDLVYNYLDIADDGLNLHITHVGTPALPQISCDPLAPDEFGIGSAGWTWGQVMTAISSQTGAVWYIDPDKTFHYVDDSDKQSRFGWSGLSDAPDNVTTIGYRDVEFTLDGTRLTNDHLQWGAGQGDDDMVFARTEDATSQSVHGLWQTGEVRWDMYCQDSVDLRGETWIYGSPQNRRGGKDDRFFSRVTVREPYFRVADVLSLISTEFDFNITVPVRNAEITFPTPWDIKSILTLSHEIDPPWSTLEFWLPAFNFDFNFDLKIPELSIPELPDPWGPFDPCECLEFGDFESGCVDTFTRSSASGLGTGELGAWSPNSSFKVETNRGVAMRHAIASETAIVDYTITAPGCIRWDTRPFGQSSDSFQGGIVLAARQGNRVPLSILDMSYALRLNYLGGNEMVVQYSALGDDTTLSTDRGVVGTTIITDYPDNEDVTWELHFSDDEIRVVAYPTLTPSAIILDTTLLNDPTFPSTSHYHLGFVDQIVVYNALDDDVGPAGEEAFQFDNINVCCDDPICTENMGQRLGLFGTTTWPAAWIEFADWFIGPKHFTDPANTNMVSGSGFFDSYSQDANNAVGGVTLNLGDPYEAGSDFEVLIHLTVIDPGSNFTFRVGVAGAAGGSNGTYTEYGWGTKILDILETPPGNYLYRVRVTDAGVVSAKWWAVGETEPGTTNTIFGQQSGAITSPRMIQLWLRNDSNTIPVNPAAVRVTAIEVNPDSASPSGDPHNPCDDGFVPTESGDGPSTGVPAQRQSEVGPNGGVMFLLDDQFQRGSTEVWVDGIRIRLESDYLEYPRSMQIEILDHIDVGTEEASKTVTVNYVKWTIEYPTPTEPT